MAYHNLEGRIPGRHPLDKEFLETNNDIIDATSRTCPSAPATIEQSLVYGQLREGTRDYREGCRLVGIYKIYLSA